RYAKPGGQGEAGANSSPWPPLLICCAPPCAEVSSQPTSPLLPSSRSSPSSPLSPLSPSPLFSPLSLWPPVSPWLPCSPSAIPQPSSPPACPTARSTPAHDRWRAAPRAPNDQHPPASTAAPGRHLAAGDQCAARRHAASDCGSNPRT